ncbi:protein Hook homolog 3-like [Hydractinia symbiolongicarpus]|uniref:protein Hook homolog 3-like n=1 Tax=Hydractinia symbiolongicarpus TaxID=13093 RepID=UPI002550AEC6|nr:protein Hook homolog 3-like [Hydractinia symbiolongicarpus]
METMSCDHLITWLNTFEGLLGNHHTAEDLSDGVAMAEALTQIAPEWFDADWISKIKQDISSDNHRLKLSNLKKVLKGMVDYYSEVLVQDLNSFSLPDVAEIAEFNTKHELSRMIQLVLGCAINCEDKEQYIQVIMALEEDVQLSVMNAIEELLQVKEGSRLSESGAKDEADYGRQNSLKSASFVAEKEQTAQKIHDLEEQLRFLKEEKSTLLLENERLLLAGGSSDKTEGSLSDKRVAQLQFQIDKLKEENYTLESAKEDYKIRHDEKEKELREKIEKIEQLSSLAEEARSLKDEMDILRHTQDKVARYEATIEAYKKKLGELGDMRQQMKTLEEKNEIYMQQTISLEEDSKKANTLKAQVDLYKTQIHDLHNKLLDTEKRCDKAEFDATRAKDKLQTMEAENQRLKQERDMLKETNEELTLNQTNSANVSIGGGVSAPTGMNFDDMALQGSPFELKEKLIRLEHQNKLYALQLQEAENEKTHVLQAELDVSNERVNRLETENRQLSQEILELKGRLEDTEATKSAKEEKLSVEEKETQKKLQQHLDALKQSNVELSKKKQHIDELENQTSANSNEISLLRDQLMKKDEQMKEMEDRYKKYLDKAKTVIKTINPTLDSAVNDHQVKDLKSRLQEKEKLIEHLERDHERMKQTKEREEKLIISAWYELSMQLHRKAADERQAGGAGLSFLAKQRQAASIRRSSLSGSPRGKISS